MHGISQNFDPYATPGQRDNINPATKTQNDSDTLEGTVEKDTTPFTWKQNPKVATLLALGLPGAGQIYNKKYWKLPIVWGGLGILIYQAAINGEKYNIFREAFNQSKSSDFKDVWARNNHTELELWRFSTINLSNLKDTYRQDRDRYIIFTVLVYICSVVDAAVDAHLSKFDVSDNLSLRINPTTLMGYTPGIQLSLELKQTKNHYKNKRYSSLSNSN